MEDVYPPEVWREVPGTEGYYSASSLGHVRRNDTGHILSGCAHGGYIQVHLSIRGRRWKALVHRLVAAAFLGEPEEGQVVNHINNDGTDNRPENLEWTTPRGNIRHALENGYWWRTPPDRSGTSNGRARLTPGEVREIRRLAGTVTQRSLAQRYGVGKSQISRIVRGEQWQEVS